MLGQWVATATANQPRELNKSESTQPWSQTSRVTLSSCSGGELVCHHGLSKQQPYNMLSLSRRLTHDFTDSDGRTKDNVCTNGKDMA